MFTVNQLARLAGVTPRALRHYDAIGLLKPTRVGANGYRYYDDAAALRLQQILLYRELGLPLARILKIMGRRNFDVAAALAGHRQELRQRIAQLERLVATVDNTLLHIQGEKTMSAENFFAGFSEEQQAAYEQEAMQRYDPAIVKASQKKWKAYTAAEKARIGQEGREVYLALVQAIPLGPASPEAQAGVARWRKHLDYFWTPNDQQLLALAEGYSADPRFKANFDAIDPRLAEFVRAAVQVFVNNP